MMYTHRTAYTLVSIFALAAILIVSHYHGTSSRTISAEQGVFVVDTPEQAFSVWNEKGVRGRALVLFDRYPHIRGRRGYQGEPQLTASNLVELAVFKNIIRKVYFIVRDAGWSDFLRQERMRPLRAVHGVERGLFLYNLLGVPIIAITPSSLPQIEERPLVYINTELFPEQEARDLITQKKITSDIIISVRGRVK